MQKKIISFHSFFYPLLVVLLALVFFPLHAEQTYNYQVEFAGVDEETKTLLTEQSQLVTLIDHPPLTAAALQYRINDDIAGLLKVLQSAAYYNPTIHASVDNAACPILITLNVNPGPVYQFHDFKVTAENDCCQALCEITLDDMGITLGAPAYSAAIIEAEEELFLILKKRGYPLAKLVKREVSANVAESTISVNLIIHPGPQAFFGKTEVCGNETLLPVFFCRKIAWSEGALYNPALVQRTLNALELSGLFSSITVSHGDEVDENGLLPMHIAIKEAKQRSIGFGLGYATTLGFGVNAEWEHRNITGTGDKLSLVANIWQIRQEGFIRYIQPDFLCPRQDLIWAAEVEHEDVKAFREASFSLSSTIERQLDDRLRISYGAMFTRLRNTHSDNNGTFSLVKLPLQLFWNGANRLMDPTKGIVLHLKTTPTLQTQSPCFAYTNHFMSVAAYQPFGCNDRFVLAGKATLGSIWGASKHNIPPSERFYAGSDTLLRGYHYLTVSPLNEFNKPIGGRSLMVYSLEARMRVWDPFGVVFFYDVGNVYSQSLPQFDHKQLQSAGIGLRYHTPVGPIRLDLAFPFNPRKHLDGPVQLYFSIGQSF